MWPARPGARVWNRHLWQRGIAGLSAHTLGLPSDSGCLFCGRFARRCCVGTHWLFMRLGELPARHVLSGSRRGGAGRVHSVPRRVQAHPGDALCDVRMPRATSGARQDLSPQSVSVPLPDERPQCRARRVRAGLARCSTPARRRRASARPRIARTEAKGAGRARTHDTAHPLSAVRVLWCWMSTRS
jgi:hypothetical protein